MQFFKRLWRMIFPPFPEIPEHKIETDCHTWLVEVRIRKLREAMARRNEDIAEARRRKGKRSHLVKAQFEDRTEILKLEQRLKELTA